MNPSAPEIDHMLNMIDQVHLQHPASALLRVFILEAVQPQKASEYVQSRLKTDGNLGLLLVD